MSKNRKYSEPFPKKHKIHLLVAICIVVTVFMVFAIDTQEKFLTLPVVGSLAVGHILTVLMLYGLVAAPVLLIKGLIWKIGNNIHKVNAEYERREQEQEQLRQQKELEKQEQDRKRQKMIAEGKWAFPNTELYKRCEKAGVTDLNTAFARRKVYAVAKQILVENDIHSDFTGIYIGDAQDFGGELLKGRFEKGKHQTDMDRHKPKTGTLSAEHQKIQKQAKAVSSQYGHGKRSTMLKDSIRALDDKIKKYEEGQKAIREVGILLATSVSQEPEKDWAFLGGIASGIAGAGAGVAVAANAMAENAAIAQRNRQAREAANAIAADMYRSASSMSGEIVDMKNARDIMQYHLDELNTKIVMREYTMEDITKHMKLTADVRKTASGDGLEVCVRVRNNFVADVPDGVQVAVDGTFNVEILYEGNVIDWICIALPLFGVPQKETATVMGYSSRYVEADGEYTVKFHPNKLWVMEV